MSSPTILLFYPHIILILHNPSQTQILPPRNYDPPPIPSQFSAPINTHVSPQPSSSNTHSITQNNNTVHFQTPTPPSSSEIQTLTYTQLKLTSTNYTAYFKY